MVYRIFVGLQNIRSKVYRIFVDNPSPPLVDVGKSGGGHAPSGQASAGHQESLAPFSLAPSAAPFEVTN